MVNSNRKAIVMGVLIVGLGCILPCVAQGGALTIREIQYTEAPDGDSAYNGQVVDCAGGVAFLKTGGGRPRLFLQDPNALDGWGAIQVKGWTTDAFASISVGDWVEIKQVFVEENRGTTFLQYWDQNTDGSRPVLAVVSHGHSLSHPLAVTARDIQAPAYVPLEDAWLVADHRAEKFESMLLRIDAVAVGQQGLGKAQDNYELGPLGDPNDAAPTCWASDYLNGNKPKTDLYLAQIQTAVSLRAVTGVLEQYTSLADGYDYYQLLTVSSASVVGLCPADLNRDGTVDLRDCALFVEQLLTSPAPAPSELYQAADLNHDGQVNAADLDLFNAAWRQADVNGDGIVNGSDLAF